MKSETDTRKPILDILAGVLESFAFLFLDPADADDLAVVGSWRLAEISFSGAGTGGTLSIALPIEACRELAANALGKDLEETDDLEAEDGLRELANIACGEVTVTLFDREAVFDLTVPVLRQVTAAEVRDMLGEPLTLAFELEEHAGCARLIHGGQKP
jgi:hypothetical protein